MYLDYYIFNKQCLDALRIFIKFGKTVKITKNQTKNNHQWTPEKIGSGGVDLNYLSRGQKSKS